VVHVQVQQRAICKLAPVPVLLPPSPVVRPPIQHAQVIVQGAECVGRIRMVALPVDAHLHPLAVSQRSQCSD
jgi:hypothetical protein